MGILIIYNNFLAIERFYLYSFANLWSTFRQDSLKYHYFFQIFRLYRYRHEKRGQNVGFACTIRHESLMTSQVKHCQQKISFCSIFEMVPRWSMHVQLQRVIGDCSGRAENTYRALIRCSITRLEVFVPHYLGMLQCRNLSLWQYGVPWNHQCICCRL